MESTCSIFSTNQYPKTVNSAFDVLAKYVITNTKKQNTNTGGGDITLTTGDTLVQVEDNGRTPPSNNDASIVPGMNGITNTHFVQILMFNVCRFRYHKSINLYYHQVVLYQIRAQPSACL